MNISMFNCREKLPFYSVYSNFLALFPIVFPVDLCNIIPVCVNTESDDGKHLQSNASDLPPCTVQTRADLGTALSCCSTAMWNSLPSSHMWLIYSYT